MSCFYQSVIIGLNFRSSDLNMLWVWNDVDGCFPIGTRQEHICIGFLLTKIQLSPDDHDDDDDDGDDDDDDDDDDDAFTLPATHKLAIKRWSSGSISRKMLINLLVFNPLPTSTPLRTKMKHWINVDKKKTTIIL